MRNALCTSYALDLKKPELSILRKKLKGPLTVRMGSQIFTAITILGTLIIK